MEEKGDEEAEASWRQRRNTMWSEEEEWWWCADTYG